MLWTIAVILVILWLLGYGFAGAALGNLVHILLILAVVVILLNIIRGRNPV
jgi:hypothetical protein